MIALHQLRESEEEPPEARPHGRFVIRCLIKIEIRACQQDGAESMAELFLGPGQGVVMDAEARHDQHRGNRAFHCLTFLWIATKLFLYGWTYGWMTDWRNGQ